MRQLSVRDFTLSVLQIYPRQFFFTEAKAISVINSEKQESVTKNT